LRIQAKEVGGQGGEPMEEKWRERCWATFLSVQGGGLRLILERGNEANDPEPNPKTPFLFYGRK